MSSGASILVVGGGLAGWSCVRELRKLDQRSPILLVAADAGDFYAKPALSNALAQGRSAAALVTTAGPRMAEQHAIDLHARTRIVAIDADNRRVVTTTGTTLDYRTLVLALGADAIRLPLAGDAADAILSVNDLDDYASFRQRLAGVGHVAILGAGLIGCEFANDLAGVGIKVTLIDPAATPLAALLPPEAGRQLLAPLAAIGVDWRLGITATRVDRDPSACRLRLSDGSEVLAGLVLSAVGLRPRTELARTAGLTSDRGIRVDSRLTTSNPAIHALGDCAQYPEGTLPYVMPIMHAARALAAGIAGSAADLRFPPMPVIVKTPAHPVIVAPAPRGVAGTWRRQGEARSEGLRLDFIASDDRLRGFVITGNRCDERAALTAALAAA